MKHFEIKIQEDAIEAVKQRIVDEVGERPRDLDFVSCFVRANCSRVGFGRVNFENGEFAFFVFEETFGSKEQFSADQHYDVWVSDTYDEGCLEFTKRMIEKV